MTSIFNQDFSLLSETELQTKLYKLRNMLTKAYNSNDEQLIEQLCMFISFYEEEIQKRYYNKSNITNKKDTKNKTDDGVVLSSE